MSAAAVPLLAEHPGRLLVRTRAVSKAWQILDRAQRDRTIVMVIANPGCQKSYSIKSWRKSKGACPHIYIEADLLTSPRPMLNALCEGLGIPKGGFNSLMEQRDSIVDRLAESPVGIIVDQADMLTIRTLEALRTIWDRVAERLDTDGESAFGLAIFGTPELRQRIMRPELERLHRRIAESATLDPLSIRELEAVLAAKWPQAKVEGCLEELLRLSRGSFGWLNRIMPVAQALAAKEVSEGTGVIRPHILRAIGKYLIGITPQ